MPNLELSRGQILRHLLTILGIAALVFATVGVANARLNPYVYDGDAIDDVAQGLVQGRNFANYDPNIDLRALRAAQIRHLTTTPDIVIFGGSRWQEARSESIPGGHRVLNAFVSNDQIEDMMAITHLLDQAGRLPRTMVFSLRFVSLQPVAARRTYDWKQWEADYAEMAGKLGVTPTPYPNRAPIQQWSGTFNMGGLFGRVQQLDTAEGTPALTTATRDDHLDIIASDGSLRWSKKSDAKFTKKYVDKFVDNEILRAGPTRPAIDRDLVQVLGKLIDWLRAKNVRVVLAQTPYHPVYWQRIQSYPFAKTLHGLEAVAEEMAAKHGAIAENRFDPAPYPRCKAENFVDHIHGRYECLEDMFQRMPDLVTGARR
ncbi:hypothetical protein ACQPZF_16770 [Actinosynnema sp. CS-041913]|uniref:hypothetical protein n=1 Tax=Actinosynnema sp. CS-041913 TaxID=3239917 RepID=UPI003D901630